MGAPRGCVAPDGLFGRGAWLLGCTYLGATVLGCLGSGAMGLAAARWLWGG